MKIEVTELVDPEFNVVYKGSEERAGDADAAGYEVTAISIMLCRNGRPPRRPSLFVALQPEDSLCTIVVSVEVHTNEPVISRIYTNFINR